MSSAPYPRSDSERVEQLQKQLRWAELRIQALEEQLRLERIAKYGPGSEKLNSAQLELLELEPGVSRKEVEAESKHEPPPTDESRKNRKKHPGRQELPPELPRVEGFSEVGLLVKELTEMRVTAGRSGRIRLGADDYGQHDDFLIALALAC